jgi:uncharacterized lipoprotein NlpE involved in copper resistance
MKNLTSFFFSILVLISCQNEAQKTPDPKAETADSSPIADEQAMLEQLAAFYTGTMPCPDCDGIETILTLNADEKRTFTLEEHYKGKENKTVESTGTWTVTGDVVTLNQESGATQYLITGEGLISLNPDGSKRDTASANKYLLKKVQGE